jgi:antitoxin (DNA-binding transcriptional repressor) of toxin-antitoxin stability system
MAELVDLALAGEAVAITQYGEPVASITSLREPDRAPRSADASGAARAE